MKLNWKTKQVFYLHKSLANCSKKKRQKISTKYVAMESNWNWMNPQMNKE